MQVENPGGPDRCPATHMTCRPTRAAAGLAAAAAAAAGAASPPRPAQPMQHCAGGLDPPRECGSCLKARLDRNRAPRLYQGQHPRELDAGCPPWPGPCGQAAAPRPPAAAAAWPAPCPGQSPCAPPWRSAQGGHGMGGRRRRGGKEGGATRWRAAHRTQAGGQQQQATQKGPDMQAHGGEGTAWPAHGC